MKATALTTLSNLKQALNITTSSGDSSLESLIERATDWIETQTNRKLKARNYNGGSLAHSVTNVLDEDYHFFSGGTLDKYPDGTVGGGTVYYLPAWPVQSLTLHGLNSRSVSGETWLSTALVNWQDYVVDLARGKISMIGGFTPGYRNYRVTMAAGYQTGDNQPFVPSDLEGLCIELVRRVRSGGGNLQSETIGTWSRTWDTQKDDPMIQWTLDKYTKISL